MDDPVVQVPRAIGVAFLNSEHGLRGYDPDCIRFGHPSHETCLNRDGEPVRLGQACGATARSEVLALSADGAEPTSENDDGLDVGVIAGTGAGNGVGALP